MKLFQEALNKARKQLAQADARYTPPYHPDRHLKPTGATQDAVCGDADDADGNTLGSPAMRRALPTQTMPPKLVLAQNKDFYLSPPRPCPP